MQNDTCLVFDGSTVDINENFNHNANNVLIYPNPASEFIVIELEGYEKPLVLDSKAAEKAHKKILDIYDIPSDRRLDTGGWYN